METHTFFFNDLRTCCYVVSDDRKNALIIDPGCYSDTERQRLVRYIRDNSLTPAAVLTTHCHFDHILGLDYICTLFSIPFYAHPLEQNNLTRCTSYASLFGFQAACPQATPTPLNDNQRLLLLEQAIEVRHTPGHSPGSVCFYVPSQRWLFSGDTLFAGSVGRTDLPGGDGTLLMNSLEHQIGPLPQETTVYPGHGPSTVLSCEFQKNPYLSHLFE